MRVFGLILQTIILASLAHAAPGQSFLDRAAKGVSDTATRLGDRITDAATPPTGAEIDHAADLALAELYAESPESKDLAEKAVAMLIFPTVTKGGVMVGGQYGEGVLRQDGATAGYFSLAGVSYGLQIGGQQFSYAMLFLNDAAVAYFRDNGGWEAGVGPTLVGGDEGWSRSMGTNDLQGDIVPIFWGQAGLMAGGSLQGVKVTRIER